MESIQNFVTAHFVIYGILCIIAWKIIEHAPSLFKKRESKLPRGMGTDPVEIVWNDMGILYRVISQTDENVFCKEQEFGFEEFESVGAGVFFKKDPLLKRVNNRDFFRVENAGGKIGVRISQNFEFFLPPEGVITGDGWGKILRPIFSDEDQEKNAPLVTTA